MKLEDLVPLSGSCSALPGNLSVYPGDSKWKKLLVGVVNRNHLLITSVVPGELHGMKEIFLRDKLAGEKLALHDATILKADWCKLRDASFLVLCATSGFQIMDDEGFQVVFTYCFADDDSVDEAKWEYAASVTHVGNFIFIGSSSGFFYVVAMMVQKEKTSVVCTASVIRYLRGHTSCVTTMTSVSDRTLVSGDASGKISVWKNLPDLQKVSSFVESHGPVSSMKSWNHFVVAAFGDGIFHVIDILNLITIAKVNAHSRWISGLDIAPESGKLITCSEDSIVSLWQLTTKRGDQISHVESFDIPNAMFTGVKFIDPMGNRVCVSIYDKTELPVISTMERRRIFVGGLSNQVTQDDLRSRFVRFGDVVDVELKEKSHPTTGEPSYFAFVEIHATEDNLSKCFKLFSNTRWKGGTMRLEVAKENFLSRLRKERDENASISVAAEESVPSKKRSSKSTPPEPIPPVLQRSPQKELKIKIEKQESVSPSLEKISGKKKKKKLESDSDDSEDDHCGIPNFNGLSSLEKSPASVTASLFSVPTPRKNDTTSSYPKKRKYESDSPRDALSENLSFETMRKTKKLKTEVDDGDQIDTPVKHPWASKLEAFSSDVWNRNDESVSTKKSKKTVSISDSVADPVVKISKQEPSVKNDPALENKRKQSEAVRMAKIKEMQNAINRRKAILEKALGSMGQESSQPCPNKRVIFDDDDDVGHDIPLAGIKDENVETHSAKIKRALPLNDEDSEEENDNKLRIREEFLAEGGNELLALETRYGADERFKLDSRFLGDKNHEPEVVVAPKKSSRKSTQGLVRFDPTRSDHVAKFQIPVPDVTSTKVTVKKGKNKTKGVPKEDLVEEAVAETSGVPQTSVEKFYKVSTKLKDVLGKEKQEEDSSFSLAALFAQSAGLQESKDEREVEDEAVPTYEKPTGKVPAWLLKAQSTDALMETMDEEGNENQDETKLESSNWKVSKLEPNFDNPEFRNLMEYYQRLSKVDPVARNREWAAKRRDFMDMISRRVHQVRRAKRNRLGVKPNMPAAFSFDFWEDEATNEGDELI
ncbi:unnamed protein product [Notodromas monacha]|uniref:RRM domain-containing protein n=1 Tax=Notodromas monacha TaxID=399045 RepID=A0A7R9GCT3_9CRUS|nr:unnamed protein product [Notodromas monacha]CAG0917797.1 unnamed protein product [Notodromas monacha]